ncbi:acyl-CoA/acyl-ACP dehydrogenase [Pseudonocardia sp. DSM 110487]|uniref:acyl-CoA dehydrogenase family protein n=1 Tax=Pseudonocardia sp. DSM 110487 TaxID=2865833 RepID=UPI001C6A03CD|nr:acyl-CoA dehydrogenase family protein [Pseudonocardia sp. DSM 110487]QYN39221.1 acyl-CoA/acyl-ACP dehydrogenase [Pseudonocardia sp. DSM 110487]
MIAPARDAERQDMRRTVAAFLDRHAGSARVREVMAGEPGHDVELWRRGAAELGLTAVLVPERCGGLGLDFTDGAAVLEEFGRRVVPTPLPTTLAATAVLARCGTAAADRLLTRIAEDAVSVSVAVAEPAAGWGIEAPTTEATTTATRAGERWELRGAKAYVPHGAAVDVLLVVAREGVLAVEADQPGVVRRGRVTLDQTRRLADVELNGAVATPLPGADAQLLVDLCLVALAVESAAAASACLDMTVEYLKVRHQFGRPLGSFQALKHRCADLAVQVEGAASTAWYAAAAVASGSDELPVVAPLAKLVCADTLMAVAAEAIQMHGGIGFTFEHDAHLYLKRGKADQQLYGSSSQLRRRLARQAVCDDRG